MSNENEVRAEAIKIMYAEENGQLRRDLEELWKVGHLTKRHSLGIQKCDHCGEMAYHVEKEGEAWKASKDLVAAMQNIFENYKFDSLEVWPCENCDCGGIIFERTVCGVLCDLEVDVEDAAAVRSM